MATGGSKLAVGAAIGGNALVMVAKFVAFGFTGSGAMLSEAIHSVADLLNQILLYIGLVRSDRVADHAFEYGYGAERYVWALMSAVGIFFLGCGVTIYHGITSLLNPEHQVQQVGWAIGVLILSFVIEFFVLFLAVRTVYREAGDRPFFEFLWGEADPSAVAVILEDSAACIGVLVAMIAIGLTSWTGHQYWDAIGTLGIGVLLGGVASWLVLRNRQLLVGPSIPPHIRAQIQKILEDCPAIEEVVDMRTEMMDSETYRIKADIKFDGAVLAEKLEPKLKRAYPHIQSYEDFRRFAIYYADQVLEVLGDEIDAIEHKIQTDVPKARLLDLEAD